jgi:hypothetical protein
MNLPFPMFQYGQGQEALGMISGLLLLDSGEADNTFILRCQDRYITYNSLAGLRSILFVIDEDHVSRYKNIIMQMNASLGEISEAINLDLGVIPCPLFVPVNIERAEIVIDNSILTESRKTITTSHQLLMNQLSPTAASFVKSLAHVLSDFTSALHCDPKPLTDMGELALRFHNKAAYVALVDASDKNLPLHAPTDLMSPQEFLKINSWLALLNRYLSSRSPASAPESLYVKSSFDSGGNIARPLSAKNWEIEIAKLREEVHRFILCDIFNESLEVKELQQELSVLPSLTDRHWEEEKLYDLKRKQRSRRNNIKMLIQEKIEPPASISSWVGLGFTCNVTDAGSSLTEVTGQMYRDVERRHFLGSYLSPNNAKICSAGDTLVQIENLCSLFAQNGYRGPINFDARLVNDSVLFHYDCNPRLSAVYPPMAVRHFLQSHGETPEASNLCIASLGYRGEYQYRDSREVISLLQDANLLFNSTRPYGVLPLPNAARQSGFDLMLINMEKHQIECLVASGGLLPVNRQLPHVASAVY